MEITLSLPWFSWENFKQWFTLLLSATAGLCLGRDHKNKNSISFIDELTPHVLNPILISAMHRAGLVCEHSLLYH